MVLPKHLRAQKSPGLIKARTVMRLWRSHSPVCHLAFDKHGLLGELIPPRGLGSSMSLSEELSALSFSKPLI